MQRVLIETCSNKLSSLSAFQRRRRKNKTSLRENSYAVVPRDWIQIIVFKELFVTRYYQLKKKKVPVISVGLMSFVTCVVARVTCAEACYCSFKAV